METSDREYCELCGEPIHGKGTTVLYEGSVITVCSSCYSKIAKYSKPAPNPAPRQEIHKPKQFVPATSSKPKYNLSEDLEIADDYYRLIKQARERLKMTQFQLAQKLKVSENIVKRFELGKLKPTLDQAKSLEKILGIKLIVPIESNEGDNGTDNELTLGDIVRIREGRK
ncbi:multiprotein bridging factor aMBF1 [Sulfuracidifex metallicus]|jgi:putative transcription factor|uniref:TIGR00270 family protein n=1 Tax=Sulfuracidifex metallicus DSM 6482 = JCM 9184 TaxID=523847 RepID=A0A6A9QIW0_SULME|nr:multiprotein bridging factor aMBF1 [Sulfuracidifex metallicus]MUN28604.1 TIGR00270 family protein [Sulfuracidifex metallicus DSM 6482 = JCM 9184]WOE50865.1 multiprotein bridging factor aMBF1 [Sulfuracidifex metallicus DSM 6482 = JCM 9184]